MRIDPALSPLSGPQPAGPTGSAPSQPFEEFLSGDTPPRRVFGFAELGMFGRDERAQMPADSLSVDRPPGEPGSEPASGGSLDHAVDRAAVQGRPVAQSTTRTGEPRLPGAGGAKAGRHILNGPAAPTEGGGAVPAPDMATAGEEAPPEAAADRPVNRQRSPESDVSLIVSEKDGRVHLVASGPALDTETRSVLRRLARAILARHGLDLAHFHLNGVAIAPDSTIMIGGSHGNRSS